MLEIADIIKKRFSRSFAGYDIREVDLFLDEIIDRMEAYEKERTELMMAMDILLKELEQFDEIRAAAERARSHVPDFEEQLQEDTELGKADDACEQSVEETVSEQKKEEPSL